MELLQEIQTSSTRKSPFAEAALQKLLDSNLSAKYALTGVLSKCFLPHNSTYYLLRTLVARTRPIICDPENT